MSAINKKGPVFDAGLCRCCGSTKRCRLLNVEYQYQGQKEIYSEMFLDCFGLVLAYMDSEESERLICATCVSRLREASSFRLQVLRCEERLLRSSILMHAEGGDTQNGVKAESIIKEETQDMYIDIEADHDHEEAMPLDCDMADEHSKSKELQPKQERMKHKIRKSVIGPKKRRREVSERKQMLSDMKRVYDRLRRIQTVPEQPKYMQKSVEFKDYDNSDRSLHNLHVLVENSYVCPFNTSFSDYFCIYCRQKFTDPANLRDHTFTHNPKEFSTVLKNSGLSKKLQVDIARVDCRLCADSVASVEEFKSHVATHGKVVYDVPDDFLKFRLGPNLSCLECGAGFGFFHALKKHMAEHFGSCICDVCGAHYFEQRMLVLHQKTHQRVEESYTCKECGKCFKSKYTRYIHIARQHKREAAYQCNKCDEVFFSYTTRYRHMMDAHGEVRTYKCEHCDRAYDSRKSLREHNRRLHLKIMKHQCDLCDKRFYLPSRLREHMSSHTGERNFRCEYCGKSFPRLRGLKVHMQSHSTEKKYKCALCNASFTQNVNLKNHVKRQHQSMEVEGFQ